MLTKPMREEQNDDGVSCRPLATLIPRIRGLAEQRRYLVENSLFYNTLKD